MEIILQTPAETTNYMIAGFGVIFGIMLLYVISLYIRNRNNLDEYLLLLKIKQDENPG